MNLLHIDTAITGGNSVSQQISAAIVASVRIANPAINITRRDLDAEPIPHLDSRSIAKLGGGANPQADDAEAIRNAALVEEFLAADIVVIGAPMYNFTIPTQLKAWIDRIAVAGKTFSYGPDGVKGLAGGKRIVIALSRGGHYGAGAPAAAYEHTETYLRSVFGFIGVTDIEVIVAEGINLGPEHREKAVAGALQAATDLRAA